MVLPLKDKAIFKKSCPLRIDDHPEVHLMDIDLIFVNDYND